MDSVGVVPHPILDRYRRLFAYEFQFRGPGSDEIQRKGVGKAEFEKLQGDRPVFVNVTEAFLRQGFTSLLTRDPVILEFRPNEVDSETLLHDAAWRPVADRHRARDQAPLSVFGLFVLDHYRRWGSLSP